MHLLWTKAAWFPTDISEELFLQQLRRKFSNSTETENEDLEQQRLNLMIENYNRYKRDYVKHIWFNPEEDDSSRWHSSLLI